MQEFAENVYRVARMRAGMTQAEAADAIAVSVRSISDYEIGKTGVPDEVALLMVKAYSAPWLRLEHLKRNPVFMDVLGELNSSQDVSSDVLRMFKEGNDVVRQYPLMVEETVSRKTLSTSLLNECKEACRALFSLIAGIKKEPSMLAHQRSVSNERLGNHGRNEIL